MLTKNPNFSHDFFCEYCKTKSNNKKDFSKHLLTAKHKKSISLTKTDFSLTEKSPKGNDTFICNLCNKIYKSRVGLWYHHKKCESQCNEMKEENKIVDVMAEQNQILIDQNKQLLEQHNDLKKMIIDICSNMKDTNINTNNYINSHNKTFNLQFFLNETCKNAMNITDFANSIQLQLTDLENVGKNGFVAGISNIIIQNLKQLDVTQRPVHCSDQKREIIYVKDHNQWFNDSKEIPENQKLKKIIKQIAHKNICMIPEWKAKYPDCIYSESKKSDQYNHIIYESMSQSDENSEKIIKKIAKEVTIEK